MPRMRHRSMNRADLGTGRGRRGAQGRAQRGLAGVDARSDVEKRRDAMDVPDSVTARCWCDKTFVQIPLTDVRAGRTISCGRPKCKPPT